jgi:REP element-mobilizing transposase RayT
MGRRRRDLSTSTWFHVNNRGSDRQDIFSADGDRLTFEWLLGDVDDRFAVEIHAYVLMSNHFHLLLHDPGGELSAAMQYLTAKYATAYNRRTSRDGPLLTGRFHSTPIVDDAQLCATARYIHRNPLAFVPKSALGAYRWSSLPVVLGRRTAPPWLQLGVVRSVSEHADDHLRFVVTDLPSDGTVGADGRIRAVTLNDVVAVVASVGGCQPADISEGRGGDPARLRMITVTIALGERVADSLGLASELGLDPQSVRRIARGGRVALADDPSFSRLHQEVLRRLRDLERRRSSTAA